MCQTPRHFVLDQVPLLLYILHRYVPIISRTWNANLQSVELFLFNEQIIT